MIKYDISSINRYLNSTGENKLEYAFNFINYSENYLQESYIIFCLLDGIKKKLL